MESDRSAAESPEGEALAQPSFMDDLRYYLVQRKRWWLGGAALLVAALVGLIVLANGGEPIDPFLYDH